MTNLFCFGSINLTDIFGVTDATQVKESLRPYLYINDAGKVYLNVTFKNLKEAYYNKTHSLVASKKGTKESLEICKFQEFIREQPAQEQGQATAPPPASAEEYAPQGAGASLDNMPF